MIKSKIALVALVTAVGIASPALAQSRHVQRNDTTNFSVRDYDRDAPNWNAGVNSDSPALTGGGSIGGNELMHDDTE
jgi:hypothetical protein